MTEITLIGIAYRPKPGMPMQTRQSCNISVDYGVEGDSRGNLSVRKSNKRQVSILSQESWEEALAELTKVQPYKKGQWLPDTESDLFEKTLHWSARRANLLISGKTFSPNDVGKQIHIGQVQLEITCETDPCSKMDKIQKGLKKALYPNWRGGICTKVIRGGKIRVGDVVSIEK